MMPDSPGPHDEVLEGAGNPSLTHEEIRKEASQHGSRRLTKMNHR